LTRLVWTRLALRKRREIFDWRRRDEPAAAKRMAQRLTDRANSLKSRPRQGRKGRVEDTFELVVSGTPYLIIYALARDQVTILTILHHAQIWPPDE
jgi:toxin ParE1/3/4